MKCNFHAEDESGMFLQNTGKPHTRLNSVTTQKIKNVIFTAVRISNLRFKKQKLDTCRISKTKKTEIICCKQLQNMLHLRETK
jgi:hypothetical protein